MGKHQRIVEALSEETEGLSINEIAQKTNLPARSIFDILNGIAYSNEFIEDSRSRPAKYKLRQS